jgi:hypothetical protein
MEDGHSWPSCFCWARSHEELVIGYLLLVIDTYRQAYASRSEDLLFAFLFRPSLSP